MHSLLAFLRYVFVSCALPIGLYWETGHLLLKDIYPPGQYVFCKRLNTEGVWTEYRDSPTSRAGSECARHGIDAARTLVFVTLALSENIRVYTVRHFYSPFFMSFFSNPHLLVVSSSTFACALLYRSYAVLNHLPRVCFCLPVSMAATVFIALTPGVQAVFHVTDAGWHLWFLAIGGALFTLVVDEWVKTKVREWATENKHWKSVQTGFTDVLTELRILRQSVMDIEKRIKHSDERAEAADNAKKGIKKIRHPELYEVGPLLFIFVLLTSTSETLGTLHATVFRSSISLPL